MNRRTKQSRLFLWARTQKESTVKSPRSLVSRASNRAAVVVAAVAVVTVVAHASPDLTTTVADSAGAETAARRPWRLDGQRSRVALQAFKDGLAARLAHDHVIRAGSVRGQLTVNGDDVASAVLNVTVPTAALVADEAELRARYGLPGILSDSDRATITAHMLGEDVLDAEHFAVVSFRSTRFEPTPTGALVRGELTLHGVTRAITVPVTLERSDDRVLGSGSFEIAPSQYGIEPFSTMLGAIKVKDRVIVHLELVAVRGP